MLHANRLAVQDTIGPSSAQDETTLELDARDERDAAVACDTEPGPLARCIDNLVAAAGRVAVAQAEVDGIDAELAEIERQLADATQLHEDRNAAEQEASWVGDSKGSILMLQVYRLHSRLSGETAYVAERSEAHAVRKAVNADWPAGDGREIEVEALWGDYTVEGKVGGNWTSLMSIRARSAAHAVRCARQHYPTLELRPESLWSRQAYRMLAA